MKIFKTLALIAIMALVSYNTTLQIKTAQADTGLEWWYEAMGFDPETGTGTGIEDGEDDEKIKHCNFVNDQDCAAYDPNTNTYGTGCEDSCDADSGTPCSGPVSCYYSTAGCW